VVIRRGEIWWASLEEPHASSPGFERPVLVIQSDAFNRSRISTIVIAAISSNLRLAEAPGNVAIARQASGLPKPSVVNVSQILSIDRSCLDRRVRQLRKQEFEAVEAGLRLVLALTRT
jgi:mRNA interferase MazF